MLYVMRHGPAEDRAPSGRDFDRPLTSEGRTLVQAMAQALLRARNGAPLPRILTSPRIRAHETATLVQGVVCRPEMTLEVRDELDGEQAIPPSLAAGLAGGDALLVGHQPVVEGFVRSLLRPDPLPFQGFRTAMIVGLVPGSAEGPAWRLAHVLDPQEVVR